MKRGSESVLELVGTLAAGAALVRADGEAFEAHGLVDREEATWVARALAGSTRGSFELTAGKRVRWIDAYEVTPGTALVVVRDGSRPLDESRLDRVLGSLRKGTRGPVAATPRESPSLGAMQARRR
ncbi:MAG: hypothetical protein ACXWUG_13385 [Polyangiales bacterium]